MGKFNKLFCVSLIFLMIGFELTAQNQQNNQSKTSQNEISSADNSSLSGNKIDESQIFLDTGDSSAANNQNETNYSSRSSNWFFVRMVIVLILLVIAIYFILRFFKKKANPEVEDSDFMRRVASINIAPGRTVEIVTLLDQKGYVLGVTENNINLIAEIGSTSEEKELISALNLTADKKQKNSKPVNFSEVLDMFLAKGKKSENIFKETEQKIDQFEKDNLSEKNNE